MKKILLVLDDDLAKVLEGKANKSETVREALRLYNEHITTDTLAGMRQAFVSLRADMAELQQKYDDQYAMLEQVHNTINELRQ